jgi:uncharacterized repeat protein (TIGR01451 family)
MRLVTRWSRPAAVLVAAFVAFGLLGWQGVSTAGHGSGNDAGEHLRYAQYADAHGTLPGKARNYEYATPPLFHLSAIGLERAVHRLPSHALELGPNPVTRAVWLALALAGIGCMTSARRRIRLAGLGALGLAVTWGLDEAISLCKSEPWTAGQLLSLAACAGLVLVTGLIAREVWPDRPRRALAAGAFVAAYPVVFRMGILFHPEMSVAFLDSLAVLVFLCGARLGWPRRLGWALGAACGAAALTRQTALVVIACIAVAGLVAGRRRAGGFLARAALLTVILVSPWWVHAYRTWHNPLQSNLARPGLMLSSQPASFFVSFPLRTLVVHPYRPDFTDELLPKLHAELWSDWFGVLHPFWSAPSRLDRVTASSQSLLGFVGDALAIGGLIGIGVPAGVRGFSRRGRLVSDLPLGFLALLTVAAMSAFLLMLIRFPQRDGDPIKSSYLLFTAPCWAVFSVAAWVELVRRRARAQMILVAIALLYVASYGADLAGALAKPWPSHGGGGGGQPAGSIDLSTSIQGSPVAAYPGSEVNFAVFVRNNGTQTADGVRLTVELAAGMELLGPPYYERGSGCTGAATLECSLSFLAGGKETLIRFAVRVNGHGDHPVTASVSSAEADLRPADNGASFTVHDSTASTPSP